MEDSYKDGCSVQDSWCQRKWGSLEGGLEHRAQRTQSDGTVTWRNGGRVYRCDYDTHTHAIQTLILIQYTHTWMRLPECLNRCVCVCACIFVCVTDVCMCLWERVSVCVCVVWCRLFRSLRKDTPMIFGYFFINYYYYYHYYYHCHYSSLDV